MCAAPRLCELRSTASTSRRSIDAQVTCPSSALITCPEHHPRLQIPEMAAWGRRTLRGLMRRTSRPSATGRGTLRPRRRARSRGRGPPRGGSGRRRGRRPRGPRAPRAAERLMFQRISGRSPKEMLQRPRYQHCLIRQSLILLMAVIRMLEADFTVLYHLE